MTLILVLFLKHGEWEKSIYQIGNNVIIRKKGYFHIRMLEVIIFDSKLEKTILGDLVSGK